MPAQNVNLVNSPVVKIDPSDQLHVFIDGPRFAGESPVNTSLNATTKPYIYYFSVIDPNDGKVLHEESYWSFGSVAYATLYQKAAHVSGWYINLKHASLSTSSPVYVDVLVSGGYIQQNEAHTLVRTTYMYQSETQAWKANSIANVNYALTTV